MGGGGGGGVGQFTKQKLNIDIQAYMQTVGKKL